MVKQIASRAAGLRLMLIVAILMLPIIVLGMYMVQSLQHERTLLSNELKGVAFSNLIMPIFADSVNSRISEKNVLDLKASGPRLAAELNGTEKLSAILDALSAKNPDFDKISKLSNALLIQSAETSGLILDSELESYSLAVAATTYIPETMLRAKTLQVNAMHALATFGNKQPLAVKLLLAGGRLTETVERTTKAMTAASKASQDNMKHAAVLETLAHLAIDANATTTIIEKDNNGNMSINMQKIAMVNAELPHIINESFEIWSPVAEALEQQLQLRYAGATRYMLIMGAIALVTTLFAFGIAISMFKSTLNQLDLVEEAKNNADLSRDAAEEMSAKLTVINEDMVKLNRDLESNMRQLTEAQAEIVKKTKFANLGQLTATVAHELRNPLGAVRTSAFLLERKLKGKGLGVESQLLRINNGITRCDDTITQLLDFSRSKQINTALVEVDKWLIGVIEEEARKLPTAVNIACSLGLEGYKMPFDKARLERAIVNMIANASEAMVGKGEGTIAVVTQSPTITIETRLNGSMFEIEIADNGPGISAENLLKIREPMFTTKNFGTGLGIPAVEQILEQHNGKLDIQSTVGKGAKFIMSLPIEQNQEEAA